MAWICSIYDRRPVECRTYPRLSSYRPPGCTYSFDRYGNRHGSCSLQCGGACCRVPRLNGEPTAPATPRELGGRPCKYLVHAGDGLGAFDSIPRPVIYVALGLAGFAVIKQLWPKRTPQYRGF